MLGRLSKQLSKSKKAPYSADSVVVAIPLDARPGDLLQALAPDGSTFAFTVPAEATPGGTVEVSIPDNGTGASDSGTTGDSGTTRCVTLPTDWDGTSLLAVHAAGIAMKRSMGKDNL